MVCPCGQEVEWLVYSPCDENDEADKEEEKTVVEDGRWGNGGGNSHKITQTNYYCLYCILRKILCKSHKST